VSTDSSIQELVDAIEFGFDRHFPYDLYVPDARAALTRLEEQLEAVQRECDGWRRQYQDIANQLIGSTPATEPQS
jgi:hypothetical protein